jgi:uncharacterized Zn-binding protein involved in type VI secretion
MVAVRAEVLVFDVKLQVMVPVSVPLTPDVIESQLPPDVTAAVHGIVPVPVLETLNDVVPISFATLWVAGDTDRTGCVFPACVTVTSTGLPVAPVAVTRMVAVRAWVLVFDVKLQLIVPVSVPLPPDVIESQLPPGVTAAVHGIVPVPVLETLNDVVPISFATFRMAGDTDRTGCVFPACVTVTSTGLPVAPVAVIWMVAVRAWVLVFDVKLQLIVPVSVPLPPDVIESQLPPDVTAAVHGIVPVPVLETLNNVVPISFATFWVAGDTNRTGCVFPACVTVTSTGLPVAPFAVTRMVARRAEVLVFDVKLQVMVPVSTPLVPVVIESQLSPDVTVAVHSIVPAPVLETLNVVVPASLATSRLAGLTKRTDDAACPPRTQRIFPPWSL